MDKKSFKLKINKALKSDLSDWDDKSADTIKSVYLAHSQAKDFTSSILALIENPACTIGATWLLKHHLESNVSLTENERTVVYQLLPELEEWQARLHILQSIPYMPIPEPCWQALEIFLRQSLNDPNKFVRAWTYNGLHELAEYNDSLREEVDAILEMGLRDEPASVKARIRNIKKP